MIVRMSVTAGMVEEMRNRSNVFRSLLSVLLLLAAAVSGFSVEFRFVRQSASAALMEKEIDAMWTSGFAPVGIEKVAQGKDAGLWVLYVERKDTGYLGWSIVEYDSARELESDIQRSLRKGWIPFDLSLDAPHASVLYLKLDNEASGWKIESAGDRKALEKKVAVLADEDYIPLGLSTDEDGDILVQLLKINDHDIREWKIVNFDSPAQLEKELPGLAAQDWEPYGFMLRENQIQVLILK